MQTLLVLTSEERQGAYTSGRPSVGPRNDSGSPACEPPLDRASEFAPSSTTAPPAYGPLRFWPRRGASGPSVVRTCGPDSGLLWRRWQRLPPGDSVKTDCLVCCSHPGAAGCHWNLPTDSVLDS